jgi:hypothetical protein
MAHKTVQFYPEDITKIKLFRDKLQKEVGMKLSLGQAIMHSINKQT